MATQKHIIIIGATQFSKLVRFYLEKDGNKKVAAFAIDSTYISADTFDGLPLVSFENVEEWYKPVEFDAVLGIGYRRMNAIREEKFYQCKEKGYYLPNFIHSTAYISPGTCFGEGNLIFEKVLIEPFSTIGNGNLIWYDAKIAHNDLIKNFNTIAGNVSLSGFITIQNRCFLGNSSVVKDGLTIADCTLLGAGSYLARNTRPYDVIVPARSVTLEGKRSIDML